MLFDGNAVSFNVNTMLFGVNAISLLNVNTLFDVNAVSFNVNTMWFLCKRDIV